MAQRRSTQTRVGAFAAAIALTGGCGGGGGSDGAQSPAPTATAAARPVTQSDLDIAQSVYGGSARTPDGFYTESAPSGHSHVATVHLKNTDLNASDPSAPSYELCTDDWNEALAWSEASAQQAPQYADLVATNDDPRYFEFGRTRASDPEGYHRGRVFKCAYLDRSTANLRLAEGPAGLLNVRPIGLSEVKALSEYLWQFTAYNNFGYVVLKSAGAATANGFQHTVHIAALTRGGLTASCDRIDVIAWRHELEASTGALERTATMLWSFGARENAGVAQLCSA